VENRFCSTIRPATRSSCFSQPRLNAHEAREVNRAAPGAHAAGESDSARRAVLDVNPLNLIPLHLRIRRGGAAAVGAGWTRTARRRIPGPTGAAFAWGVPVLVLGMTQVQHVEMAGVERLGVDVWHAAAQVGASGQPPNTGGASVQNSNGCG
jgi:hypothetical protein